MTNKKAKVANVKIKKVSSINKDKHIVDAEIELHAPLEDLPSLHELPLNITPDAVEPEKKGFWSFLFGN